VWPESSGTVADDLAVGHEGKAQELDLDRRKGEDLWKILVLAPLTVH
jgi:hypothetical protein